MSAAASDSTSPPRLSIVTLGVADVARSADFYQQVGFLQPHDLPDIVFLRTTGPILALYRWEDLAEDAAVAAHGTGFRGVTLACALGSEAAVDAAYRRWVDAGAASVVSPVRKDWGGYSAYVADPDGHLWELAHNPSTELMQLDPDGVLRLTS